MGNNTRISMEYDGMESASDRLGNIAEETREAIAKLSTAMNAATDVLIGQSAVQIIATWQPLGLDGIEISGEVEKLSGKLALISHYVSSGDESMAQIIRNSFEYDQPPDVAGDTEA